MKNLILSAALAASVAACAQSPDAIAPIPMGNAYTSLSCRDARVALSKEYNLLRVLSDQQRSAQTGDALGVFLIGVPVSSLSGGDKEGLIAASKGKVLALEERIRACGG